MGTDAFVRFLTKKGPKRAMGTLFRFIADREQGERELYVSHLLSIVATLIGGANQKASEAIYFELVNSANRAVGRIQRELGVKQHETSEIRTALDGIGVEPEGNLPKTELAT